MNYYEIAEYNPIRSDFVIPAEFVPIRRFAPEIVLTQDAIKLFSDIGLNLREVQMFTTRPYTTTGIHIDGHEITSKSAINYVVDGHGLMKWYRLTNNKILLSETQAGTSYMSFSKDDCEETDSLNINKLTLVEVCQPHNIVNLSDNFRYCFSIRYGGDNFIQTKEKLRNAFDCR
jgi:hypothetical protein